MGALVHTSSFSSATSALNREDHNAAILNENEYETTCIDRRFMQRGGMDLPVLHLRK